jgi:hypothetical protein
MLPHTESGGKALDVGGVEIVGYAAICVDRAETVGIIRDRRS